MKIAKRIAFIFILIAIVLSVCAMPVASADSSRANSSGNKNVYTPEHNGYSLQTITDGENPIGVRFSGFYFGGSDIQVIADIYSSKNYKIDFYINDVSSAYSESQAKQRQSLLNLTESMHALINNVDIAANTQYNGQGKLPISDIYRYNQAAYGEKLSISNITFEMLQTAREMYIATNGAFNPAVYRLVDLWGFSSRIFSNGNFGLPYDREVTSDEFFGSGYPLPNDKYVKAFSNSEFTDFADNAVTLSQENGQYFVAKNVKPAVVDGVEYQQWLDLGGIAKGYVVDYIKKMFSDLGIDRYNVDAGSSSMAFGYGYDGESAKMTLPDPFDKLSMIYAKPMVSVNLQNASVSTSGQYIRKYTTNGVEYSHIIDGKSGAPAQTGVKLVTIVAPEGNFWAGKGDCLTTALTVMGRDGIVDFMNGYLKDNGIKIIVLYQSEKGSKQILSNMQPSEITKLSDAYNDYVWAIAQQDGKFVYVEGSSNWYIWLAIALLVVVALAVIAVVIYHVLRGKRKALDTVRQARKDKPFKIFDLIAYGAVLAVIAVLFGVFFGAVKTDEPISVIKIVDMETEQVLYSYNVASGQDTILNGANGWTITTDPDNDETEIRITFKKTFDGEERFNTVQIKLDNETTVKMFSSKCGFAQDCVKTFGEITNANGVIVCSPNRLKIITQ